jgi:predicted DNA-binding protein
MVSEIEKVEKTTIQLTVETKKRLDDLGTKIDTYEDIIKRLLNEHELNKPQ